MATMILVEDESFERNSLINRIDWSLIGVQVIGEASNGAQGLSAVVELRPDIVLTDVKMPVMDGLEMSRKIRNIAPEIKILLLSSYDDFEYAKQAIDLSIYAYLMKPINEGELMRAVKKAADDVTEKILEDRLYNKIKNNYSISLNLARQALVSRILTGMQTNESDVRSMGLEWLCSPGQRLCLLLSFYQEEQLDSIDNKIDALNRDCAKICRQFINVCINAGRLITLCAVSDENPYGDAAGMQEVLKRHFAARDIGEVRVECVCGNDRLRSPNELYSSILQQNVNGYAEYSDANGKKKSKSQIAEEVEQIIRNQCQNALTIEIIAKMLHFTPNYIGTVFKSVKKVSVNRYLMKVRIEKAEALLLGSSKSINDIVEQCGFGSITYFHTVFKREKGVTPSEFRQNGGDKP